MIYCKAFTSDIRFVLYPVVEEGINATKRLCMWDQRNIKHCSFTEKHEQDTVVRKTQNCEKYRNM